MWRLRRLLTTSAAPRRPSEAERVVLRALRGVRDPQAASAPSPDADIVYTGRVRGVRADQGTGEVSVTLPLDDHYRALSREVKAAVQGAGLPWVTSIRVRMEGEKKKEGKEAEEAQKPLQKRTANDLKVGSSFPLVYEWRLVPLPRCCVPLPALEKLTPALETPLEKTRNARRPPSDA